MTTITDATRWTAVPNDDHALFVIDTFADEPGRCHVTGVPREPVEAIDAAIHMATAPAPRLLPSPVPTPPAAC